MTLNESGETERQLMLIHYSNDYMRLILQQEQ